MKKWNKLKPNDLIDVIAPGYPVEQEVLEKSAQALEDLGYRVRVPKNLLQPDYFHSNSDLNRFSHLKAALTAKDSAAIWCLRGGYGSNRLIPYLEKLKQPKLNKLFIGISDVTSLHLFLNQKWKWSTLHGTLLDRLGKKTLPKEILTETLDVLTGNSDEVIFSNLVAINTAAKKVKDLKGTVVGGNFIVLQTSLGTKTQINLKKKFLFIEEYGERGYRIDRTFEHFKQAGAFRDCLGVLIGQFVGGNELDGSSRIQEAVSRFALENPQLPVFTGVESGHGERLRPLPFNTEAKIIRNKDLFNLHVKTGCKG